MDCIYLVYMECNGMGGLWVVYGIQVMYYIYIGMGMGYRLGYGLHLSCLYGVQWDGSRDGYGL